MHRVVAEDKPISFEIWVNGKFFLPLPWKQSVIWLGVKTTGRLFCMAHSREAATMPATVVHMMLWSWGQ